MFSRIAIRAAQIGGAATIGAAASAHQRQQNTDAPQPNHPTQTPQWTTGDQRLTNMATRLESGTHDSVVVAGASSWATGRMETTQQLAIGASDLAQGKVDSAAIAKSFEDMRQSARFGLDVFRAAPQGVSTQDASRLAIAGAKDTAQGVVEAVSKLDVGAVKRQAEKAADHAYAASTVTQEGVDKLTAAAQERAKFEASKMAVGVGISTVAGAAAYAVPGVGPFLGPAVSILGAANFGRQFEQASHDLHQMDSDPTHSNVNSTVRQIITEKANASRGGSDVD